MNLLIPSSYVPKAGPEVVVAQKGIHVTSCAVGNLIYEEVKALRQVVQAQNGRIGALERWRAKLVGIAIGAPTLILTLFKLLGVLGQTKGA